MGYLGISQDISGYDSRITWDNLGYPGISLDIWDFELGQPEISRESAGIYWYISGYPRLSLCTQLG